MVGLMDDSIHEEKEEFRLVLGTAKSKSPYGALIGEQKEALITVTDDKDSKINIYIQNVPVPGFFVLSQHFTSTKNVLLFKNPSFVSLRPSTVLENLRLKVRWLQ